MIACVFAPVRNEKKIIVVGGRCLKNDPPAKDIIAGGYWIKSGFQNEFGLLGLVFRINGSLDFLDLDFGFSGLIGLMDFQDLDVLVSFFGYWIRFLGSGSFSFLVLVIHIN